MEENVMMELTNHNGSATNTDQSCEYRDEDIEIYYSNQGGEKMRIKGFTFRIVAKNKNAFYWVCDRRIRKFS